VNYTDNSMLQEIYQEVLQIRRKIEALEELIIPTEIASREEILEIEALKKESMRGENVDWDCLKDDLGL